LATRFYIPSAAGTSGLTPTADAGWNYTSENTVRDLIRAKYASPSAIAAGVRIGPWTATAGQTALDSQLISPPLAAQTISGTLSAMFMKKEFATTDNVDRFHLAVKIINSAGVVQSTLLARGAQTGSATVENGTTAITTTFANAANLTSQTCSAGDRILVEVGYSNSTAATTPEASINFGENATDATLGNNATTTNRAAWVEFSADLTFAAPTCTAASPNNGPAAGGGSVTLTCTNLYNGTSVTFGGVAATNVVVTSMTTLTCTPPSGSAGTSVNVVVTNADGKSGTLTAGYTYNTPTAMELVFSNAGGNEIVLYTDNYSQTTGNWVDSLAVGTTFTQGTSANRPTGYTNVSTGMHMTVAFDGSNDKVDGGVIASGSMPAWANGRTFVDHYIMLRPTGASNAVEQRIVDYGGGSEYWLINLFGPGEIYRSGAKSNAGVPLGGMPTMLFLACEHNVQSGLSTLVVNGVEQSTKGTCATQTWLNFLGTKTLGAQQGGADPFNGRIAAYGVGYATGWDATKRASLYTAMGDWMRGATTGSGGTVYRLTAVPTQFAFTGNVATLTAARLLTSSRATLGFTGNGANFSYFAAPLAAARATLGFTGNVATLAGAHLLTAARATAGFTGNVATLAGAHLVGAARASLGFTGNAANLNHGYYLAATKATTVFTGLAANLATARLLTAAKQTTVFSGLPATLLKGVSLAAAKQTMVFTGLPVNLIAARSLTAQKQTMVFSGLPAALDHGYYLTATKATAVFTGLAANLARSVLLTAAKQTMVFTGLAANLVRGYYVSAARATFGFTGLAVAFSTSNGNQTLTAARQSIVFTGLSANLASTHIVTASRATLGFTGLDAGLRVAMPAASASYVFTGLAANLTNAHRLTATQATITFTGQTTLLERQLRLVTDSAAVAFTGQTTTFARGYYMLADNAAVAFTGQTTLLERQLLVTADNASIALSASSTALLYSASFHTLAVSSEAFTFTGYDAALGHQRPHTVRIVWGQRVALRVDFLAKPAANIVYAQKRAAKIAHTERSSARIAWRPEMSSPLNVNDTNRIDFTFYDTDDEDNPTDPTTVSAVVVSPSGTRTTYTYGTDSQWVRRGTGQYRLSILCSEAKIWSWTVTVTGNVAGAETGSFNVQRTA
jgi:hypothetical protein